MYRIPPLPLKSNIAPAVLGAIISGASAIGSGAMSISNSNKQHDRQLEYMDKSIDANIQQWNRENEYNLPANQMARFKDAGLNPNLIYGQSNTANGMNPSVAVPEAKMPQNAVERGVQTYNSTRLMDSQIENIQADTALKEHQAGIDDERIDLERQKLKLEGERLDLDKDNLARLERLSDARISQVNDLIKSQQQDRKESQQRINESEGRVDLMALDYQIKEIDLKYHEDRIKADLAETYSRAGLNKASANKAAEETNDIIQTRLQRIRLLTEQANSAHATAQEKKEIAKKIHAETLDLSKELYDQAGYIALLYGNNTDGQVFKDVYVRGRANSSLTDSEAGANRDINNARPKDLIEDDSLSILGLPSSVMKLLKSLKVVK